MPGLPSDYAQLDLVELGKSVFQIVSLHLIAQYFFTIALPRRFT